MIAELERAATANLAEVENAYVSQSELTNVSNKEILNLYDEKDAETDDRIRRHDTLFGLLNSTRNAYIRLLLLSFVATRRYSC